MLDQSKIDEFKRGMADKDAARARSREKTYITPAEIRQKAKEIENKNKQEKPNSWFKLT